MKSRRTSGGTRSSESASSAHGAPTGRAAQSSGRSRPVSTSAAGLHGETEPSAPVTRTHTAAACREPSATPGQDTRTLSAEVTGS